MKKLLFLLIIPVFFTACFGQSNNGTSEKSKPMDDKKVIPISQTTPPSSDLDKAIFASGCFWCTEAIFERVAGVEDVRSGYIGGFDKTPTYSEVSNGETGHAEAVIVYFNPMKVSFKQLVEYFYASHDPTQLNRQGPDVGTQYRSGIFYYNEDQKAIATEFTEKLSASGKYDKPIVTEITPYSEFYQAEGYHQDYYELHPNQPYVAGVSRPKVEKFMKEYSSILKDKYKKP